MNPLPERRNEIKLWRKIAHRFVIESQDILNEMNKLCKIGIKPIDALHIACAINAECSHFLTVDRGILKKRLLVKSIVILNPVDFIYILEELYDI